MMDRKTRTQVEKSFLTLSRSSARKKLYALRAEQAGEKQLARLFRAIAASEEAQATRFLLQLRGRTGDNDHNIDTAFNKELPALIQHYQQAAQIAAEAGETAMQSAFTQSSKVSRIQQNLRKKLELDPQKNTSYQVCSFCGFIMEHQAPEHCPVCTAPADRFKEI